jgi:N-acetylglucosamine kinase-like BadF-type ATPase
MMYKKLQKTYLIAEAGSTKIDWIVFDASGQLQNTVVTSGFNPFYHAPHTLQRLIKEELALKMPTLKPDAVYYYGSGCSTHENCAIVTRACQNAFGNIPISTETDLMAAAHGLLGHEAGIACILGTGSNACYYDGQTIIQKFPSLGFMLGDEGSGTYIGKLILTDWLNNTMPLELHQRFAERFALHPSEALNRLYKSEQPGNFLASLTPFAKENLHHEYFYSLISNAFDAFINIQLMRFPQVHQSRIAFVGSVAYHFEEILRDRLEKRNLNQIKVERGLHLNLVSYHNRLK